MFKILRPTELLTKAFRDIGELLYPKRRYPKKVETPEHEKDGLVVIVDGDKTSRQRDEHDGAIRLTDPIGGDEKAVRLWCAAQCDPTEAQVDMVLESFKKIAKAETNGQINERTTCDMLINPILGVLGYDYWLSENTISDGDRQLRPDYTLADGNVFLEAKKFSGSMKRDASTDNLDGPC